MGVPPQWLVVGGHGKGGVAVSLGSSLHGTQLPERLATGCIIEQRELKGKSMRFALLSGTGPQRGWVSTEVCQLLPPTQAEDSNVADERRHLEEFEHLQDPKVQVFDMCSVGVLDLELSELVRAKDKAQAEAEWKRRTEEQQAMSLEDEEAAQMRRYMEEAEQEAEARRLAAQEETARQRRLFEEQEECKRIAAAKAAENELMRSSGHIQVIVHVNRMLKIRAEFWVSQGATVQVAKEALVDVLSKRFSTMQVNPAALRLQYANTDTALQDEETLSGSCVELEINRGEK